MQIIKKRKEKNNNVRERKRVIKEISTTPTNPPLTHTHTRERERERERERDSRSGFGLYERMKPKHFMKTQYDLEG